MKTFRRLALLGAVVLETGCGLPDTFYLAPPAFSGQFSLSTPTAAILGTSRASDIDIQFLGYELYYKFFAPNAPDSTLNADSNYGGSSNTINDLTQHGFQRVCLGPGNESGENPDQAPGYSSAPLINIKSIDPGNLSGGGFTINIVLDNTNPPAYGFTTTGPGQLTPLPVSYFSYSPPASGPTGGMEIRRFVQEYSYIESGKYCSPFASGAFWPAGNPRNYDPTQPGQVDVTPLNGDWSTYVSGSGGYVYVMMYAVCYGTATDQTTQRSSPTFLGYANIQILN
jgi:hypothetical protein